jgi:hypothetical protein
MRIRQSLVQGDYCRNRLNVYKADLLVGNSMRSSIKLVKFSLEGQVEVKISSLK